MTKDLIATEEVKREFQKQLIVKVFALYLLLGYTMVEGAKKILEEYYNDRE